MLYRVEVISRRCMAGFIVLFNRGKKAVLKKVSSKYINNLIQSCTSTVMFVEH